MSTTKLLTCKPRFFVSSGNCGVLTFICVRMWGKKKKHKIEENSRKSQHTHTHTYKHTQTHTHIHTHKKTQNTKKK